MKQNIVVYVSGYGDLQSEISLLYKYQLMRTFEFSHAGHVTWFNNFSCLGTRWRRRRSGGGAPGVGLLVASDCAHPGGPEPWEHPYSGAQTKTWREFH